MAQVLLNIYYRNAKKKVAKNHQILEVINLEAFWFYAYMEF
jgi:hypothetical protein